MRVCLIQSPAWNVETPPYGIALLAAVASKAGHHVHCLDFNIDFYETCLSSANKDSLEKTGLTWNSSAIEQTWIQKEKVDLLLEVFSGYVDHCVAAILKSESQVVGFSVQKTSEYFSAELAKRLKNRAPDKIVVFGGPITSNISKGARHLLTAYPWVDFICIGEAENSFISFLSDINMSHGFEKSIPGFVFKSKLGDIVTGQQAIPIMDLDKIPYADYSYFDLKKYTLKGISVFISRGCINRCTYCNECLLWGKYRSRSATRVFNEIGYHIKKHPMIEQIWFSDSLINGDLVILESLCMQLIASDIRIQWRSEMLVRKGMTEALFDKMKKAGCSWMCYGLESGSNKVLRLMRKGFTKQLAVDVFKKTSRAGITVHTNMISGYPGENNWDFIETLVTLSRAKKYINSITVTTCMIGQGSYLSQNYEKLGIKNSYAIDWYLRDRSNTYAIRKLREKVLYEFMAIRMENDRLRIFYECKCVIAYLLSWFCERISLFKK